MISISITLSSLFGLLSNSQPCFLQLDLFRGRARILVQLPAFFLKLDGHDVRCQQPLAPHYCQFNRLADGVRVQPAAEDFKSEALIVHSNEPISAIRLPTVPGRIANDSPHPDLMDL